MRPLQEDGTGLVRFVEKENREKHCAKIGNAFKMNACLTCEAPRNFTALLTVSHFAFFPSADGGLLLHVFLNFAPGTNSWASLPVTP